MKYILITGATSDIGKEISHRLKENNLILHGRNRIKLDSLYDSLNNPSNIIWEHDLEDIDNLALSMQNAIQDNNTLKYGGGGANSPLFTTDIKINGFIHVAGIAQFSAIKHFSIKQSEKMFRINVFSACEIIRILSSKGYKKHLEYIIFLSSIAAHRGYKIMSLYGASKASLCALSRSLSIELAPITRVNSIVLGGIRTSGTEFLYTEEFSQRMQEIYPLGQGNISDIANLVDFLCNAKSRWISGQNIFIDGGLSNLGHS